MGGCHDNNSKAWSTAGELTVDPEKGRCLIARRNFRRGELLFQEDAFVFASDDEAVPLDFGEALYSSSSSAGSASPILHLSAASLRNDRKGHAGVGEGGGGASRQLREIQVSTALLSTARDVQDAWGSLSLEHDLQGVIPSTASSSSTAAGVAGGAAAAAARATKEIEENSTSQRKGECEKVRADIMSGALTLKLRLSPCVQLTSTARCFLKILSRYVAEHRRTEERGRDGKRVGISMSLDELLAPLHAANHADCTHFIRELGVNNPGLIPPWLGHESVGRMLAILNTNMHQLEDLGG